jgi:hypothetical protein
LFKALKAYFRRGFLSSEIFAEHRPNIYLGKKKWALGSSESGPRITLNTRMTVQALKAGAAEFFNKTDRR